MNIINFRKERSEIIETVLGNYYKNFDRDVNVYLISIEDEEKLKVAYQLATINEFKRRLNNSKSEGERYNILMDFVDFYKYEIYSELSGYSVEYIVGDDDNRMYSEYKSTIRSTTKKVLELLEATHRVLTMKLKKRSIEKEG